MPLANGTWEQLEENRFVAEVEAGGRPNGPPFKRTHLRASSFEDMMAQLAAAYYAQVPPVVTRETLAFNDAVVVPQEEPLASVEDAPAPKRRGRPPKVDADMVAE